MAVAALLTGCGKEPARPPAGSVPAGFLIRALSAERSGDHLRLTVLVRVKNPGSTALELAPPVVRLWTGDGRPVNPFIAPGPGPEVMAPGAESEGSTHWWLAAADLSGALELEISGVRQPVKSSGPFPLQQLPENRTVALSFPDWKAP